MFNLDSVDPSRHAYVYATFVKPGRHTFCINNENGEIVQEPNIKPDRTISFVHKHLSMGAKVLDTFFVHNFLADFRNEPVPHFFKQRHVTVIEKSSVEMKEVFADWIVDSH